jgi:ABC-type transport system involved in multi-copper enzyme maturation permease subunit
VRFWGMLRYTMGEALRKGTLLFYFGVATIIILIFAFGIGHSPDDPSVITVFGNPFSHPSFPHFNVVEFLLLQLHSSSVFWIIFLGVFGSAGLIPAMLKKGTIDLFLSKPLARFELLMARALGAVSGIAINLIYFFIGIWLIFGLKVGVWHWGFLSSVLYVIFAFTCLFSVVTLIGLMTRSTVFSIIITFCYALISLLLESRERGLYLIWDNDIYHHVLDAFYYLTPQLYAMLDNSSRVIGQNPFIPSTPEFTFLPFLYSFFSASLLYFLATYYFSRQDY